MTTRRRKTIKRRIDVTVAGIGRVCLRTGARDASEHSARVRLFFRLIEADQLDVIRLLQSRKLSWTELRQAERKKRLHSDALAADVAIARRLWDEDDQHPGAFSLTLPRMGKKAGSRLRYECAFRQLRDYGGDFLPASAVVKDLGTVAWHEVWRAMDALSPASRNRLRAAISRFLTVFLGDKWHPFRRDVMALMGEKENETTAPREITLAEFWKLLGAMDQALIPCFVTLAATGMRIGEYLQCTADSVRRLPTIWIPDGKGGGAETGVAEHLVPFVRMAIPCPVAPAPKVWRGVQFDARYKRLYEAMRAASDKTGIACTPHYLRHLYAQLATNELPDVLAQQGLRHKTDSMTRHYAKRRVTSQVAAVVGKQLLPAEKVRGKVRSAKRRRAS